ncbi:hypothetical protein PSTG_06999 [Puccinia striiformis f. sp. tritici PST-78]|uniref:Uncharacterized protein n=1 Tax=Puccinia striiformis f. sp. tritici PST-78 TaxID=1165861 RepID=A0A0L0VKA9_9BASI|nr:hypothetical protein PSTG_06999 [Puccinia striiformis f. sp. tritici PST-78]
MIRLTINQTNKTIESTSKLTLNLLNRLTTATTTTAEKQQQPLQQLIHHALRHGHLNPLRFKKLAKNQPEQLTQLLYGSLILNDHKRANYYLNRIENNHLSNDQNDQFYSNLFRVCGLIGRGMGMMRRVMKFQLNPSSSSSSTTTLLRPTQIAIVEAYIENLIRWNQIERAWSLLRNFDFGPTIDLSSESEKIGGKFAGRLNKINQNRPVQHHWKASSSAYSSLLAVYLILNRPDLALQFQSKVDIDLTKIDQSMALIVCARALTDQKNQIITMPAAAITSSVLSKISYQLNGTQGLIDYLNKLDHHPDNRLLLSTWLDILINHQQDLTPLELSQWIESLDHLNLLGEREFEKYLRFTREWLEVQVHSKIKNYHHSRIIHLDSPTNVDHNQSFSIHPDHPSLGYHKLIQLFKKVYHPPPSSSDDLLKPSANVNSELIRILSLIGVKEDQITQLIDTEIKENQAQINSSHLIGLIWSKILSCSSNGKQDFSGLNTLIDKQIKFKYKLVLTGLLTTLILVGLISIRVPKLMIIQISKKLIDQCPSTSHVQGELTVQEEEGERDLKRYLYLINLAHSVNDWILVKDLHEALVDQFGRDQLWNNSDNSLFNHDHLSMATSFGSKIEYLEVIFNVYVKLNQPLLAHHEVLLSWDYIRGDLIGSHDDDHSLDNRIEHDHSTKKFLSSGLLQHVLESKTCSKLIDGDHSGDTPITHHTGQSKHEEMIKKHQRFLETLIRSSFLINKKLDSLNRLKRIFSRTTISDGDRERVEVEWEQARLIQIQDRLDKFQKSKEINSELVGRFKSVLDLNLPSSSTTGMADTTALDGETEDSDHRASQKLHGCSRNESKDNWNRNMKIAISLIKKLID